MSLKKPSPGVSREAALHSAASGYVGNSYGASGRVDSGRVDSGLGGRRAFVLGVFLLLALALVGRAFQLQVLDRSFYKKQGDVRQIRTLWQLTEACCLIEMVSRWLSVRQLTPFGQTRESFQSTTINLIY